MNQLHPELTPDPRIDRLLRLLPQVIQDSDAFVGRPLQALLRVMAEQVNLVEDDIEGVYDNAFVETCDDWLLPYLGELLGYRLVPENGAPEPDDSVRGRERLRAIYPRAEIAHLVRHRRRKGIMLVLEELARETTGWPARAVEFRDLIAVLWHARFPHRVRGRNVDLRDGDLLDRGFGPFDGLSRRLDIRRLASERTPGRGNLHAVGLWVWRLKVQQIRQGQARHHLEVARPTHQHQHHQTRHSDYRLERYYLSPFAIDQPLFALATPLPKPTHAAQEGELPAAIRLKAMQLHRDRYYGPDASVYLWHGVAYGKPEPIISTDLDVWDLGDWEKSLPADHPFLSDDPCAIHAILDPTRGRVLYRRHRSKGDQVIWARHHTAFSAHIGGGGYFRHRLPGPRDAMLWRVGGAPPPAPDKSWFPNLAAALKRWHEVNLPVPARSAVQVVMEIHDDAIHRIGEFEVESYRTEMDAGDYLMIRAASGYRPVIRHARAGTEDYRDWTIDSRANPAVDKGAPPIFIIDGVQLANTPLQVQGIFQQVRLRHTTLYAGEDGDGEALALEHFDGCLSLEQSIVLGAIHVRREPVPPEHCPVPPPRKRPGKVSAHRNAEEIERMPPGRLLIVDSILDGWDEDENVCLAGWPGPGKAAAHPHPVGFVDLTILRSTVFGNVCVASLVLAEDCIFVGRLRVVNTGQGCMRFCSIDAKDALAPGAMTPPRHECQPDLAWRDLLRQNPTANDILKAATARRVAPSFTSKHFGRPGYAQLGQDCPTEILRGASDESEMGVFHDLYQPQKEAILRARLAEFTLADADAKLLFAD